MVILVSLVSRSDLNGRRGIVHGFKCETTRFEVKLEPVDGEEPILLLKPQNLREVVRLRSTTKFTLMFYSKVDMSARHSPKYIPSHTTARVSIKT